MAANAKSCRPSKYNVVTASGKITYGWRCARHNIPTRRFADEATRDETLKQHRQEHKKV